MIETLFYAAGAWLAGMYGLAPLLVYRQNKLPERIKLDSVPAETILQKVGEHFREPVEEAEANGFRYVDASEFVTQPSTQTYFMLFVHDEKKLSLLLIEIANPNVPAEVYFEINQLYDDDTILDVLNASMDSAYPPSPRKAMFRFPEVRTVSELAAVTEKIIASYLSSKTSVTFPEGKELETIARLLSEEQDELIEKGYFQKEADAGLRGLTLKGAYLLTWKLLWPVKQIRQVRNKAFAKKILAEA